MTEKLCANFKLNAVTFYNLENSNTEYSCTKIKIQIHFVQFFLYLLLKTLGGTFLNINYSWHLKSTKNLEQVKLQKQGYVTGVPKWARAITFKKKKKIT